MRKKWRRIEVRKKNEEKIKGKSRDGKKDKKARKKKKSEGSFKD